MKSALFVAFLAATTLRVSCEETPYDPCAALACNEPCTVCAPDDPDCVETAVMKACDSNGACVAAPVDCAGSVCAGQPCGAPCGVTPPCDPAGVCAQWFMMGACDGFGACVPPEQLLCEPPPWDPCAGLACGDYCSPCAPEEPCPMFFAATACDPWGQCATAGTFTCEPQPDPCAGKACGDDCVIDPPCAPLCDMPSMLGRCDLYGVCQPGQELSCEPPPPPPGPCEGRLCGDPCSLCDPAAGMACPAMNIAVMTYCDAVGQCGYAYPVCR